MSMNIMPTAEYRAQKLEVSLNVGILCIYNWEVVLNQQYFSLLYIREVQLVQ